MERQGYSEDWEGKCKKHNQDQPCWDCCDDYLKEEE